MPDSDVRFAGSIPALYDRHLGPFLFEPFAADMAARLAGFEGQVLEIAAGTGIVTRAVDAALGPGGWITATDLNPPMLAHAAERLDSARVSWRQADALALPFEDASFDAVVCQFGVMFYPDRVAGHREARRVLRPGGRYLFSVWDGLDHNPAAAVTDAAAAACFPDDPPHFLARAPHGHHDAARMRAEAEAAGFAEAAVETIAHPGRAGADDIARGYCQGSPLRGEIEARDPAALERVTAAVREALAARFGDVVETTNQAHLITARR